MKGRGAEMGKPFPFYKMYPADAETDANFRGMTDGELGFYWRCLNHAWINGYLPAAPEARARMLRTPRREADQRWMRVGLCFMPDPSDPARLVNPRQERERADIIERSERAGKSARVRWSGDANASVSHG